MRVSQIWQKLDAFKILTPICFLLEHVIQLILVLGILQDPLIDYKLENVLLFISFLLFMAILLVIGYLSRDLESAIFFTFIASGSIIVVFLFTYF